MKLQLPDGFVLLDHHLVVQMIFTFGYTKSWTKAQVAQAKEMPWHICKPDIDNLAKFYLDCMTGCVFVDDSIVCSMQAKKLWAERSSVEIYLTKL